MDSPFDPRILVAPSGCWEWTGGLDDFGYGKTCHKQSGVTKSISAHRKAYVLAHGAIPPGMSVLHRCDNPPCCNPDHLFVGTQLDNMRDMVAKGRHYNHAKTHCRNGHEYTPDNTYRNGTKRFCRICNRQAVARYSQRGAA